jgi:hypothetical protein
MIDFEKPLQLQEQIRLAFVYSSNFNSETTSLVVGKANE